ncbi:MAG: class I SAM-dependent methyltransferase [Calditrichaeota bacterium]|nr:MAG: class I SAM-dependent methyltransferase [Calditrichota bacterium]
MEVTLNLSETEMVKSYFHKIAHDFDAIYTGEKSTLLVILDRILRRDMYQRYELTLAECFPVEGKKILDIGCGSGRFCIPLAKNGAEKVVGIDFAENMIQLAQDVAKDSGVMKTCKFIQDDFLNHHFDEKFDITIAVGLFDYIRNPEHYLHKIRALTKQKFIATYPIKWTYRMPIRKIRLSLKGCPVYFYTISQIKALYKKAEFEVETVHKVGKIYFVVASPFNNSKVNSHYEC